MANAEAEALVQMNAQLEAAQERLRAEQQELEEENERIRAEQQEREAAWEAELAQEEERHRHEVSSLQVAQANLAEDLREAQEAAAAKALDEPGSEHESRRVSWAPDDSLAQSPQSAAQASPKASPKTLAHAASAPVRFLTEILDDFRRFVDAI